MILTSASLEPAAAAAASDTKYDACAILRAPLPSKFLPEIETSIHLPLLPLNHENMTYLRLPVAVC